MRIDLLIASLVVMVIGLVISGMIGSLILAVGIILILYVILSREEAGEPEPARYVEPEYHKETPRQSERKKEREYEEPRPRKRNVDRAERELRAWSPGKQGKRCPECGSTNNPSDARFCVDCGSKI
ncbi:MAG: zinc ribbon domain-containing protein [Methanobacterium sp.]